MTSDLVRRLRDHPAKYGGPTLKDGIWSTMLEAADRLEAYETGHAAIRADIDNLIGRDLALRAENQTAADEIGRLRAQIRARRHERRRIFMQVTGLRQALHEIAGALPLSVERTDPVAVQDFVAGVEISREPAEHFVYEQQTKDQPAQDAAAQPGSSGDGEAAPEGGATGEPVPTQAEAPATT